MALQRTPRWSLSLVLCAALSSIAAPFERTVRFTQPDGRDIELSGRGDEFHAVFETKDGYTVLFDPARRAYAYATWSDDAGELVASPLQVGRDNPMDLGLGKHLRDRPKTIAERAATRFSRWDRATRNGERWRGRKAALLANAGVAVAGTAPIALAPPSFTMTGTKAGLCLLIDFDDDPATIPQADIVDFCNGDAFSGDGNNGSVKRYFQYVSNNLLTYTNIVTAYIRIPNSLHPKSYYNDVSKDCGDQANLLIRDAIAILKALPNYASEIAPAFAGLTRDGSGRVLACNVFYAGGNGGAWSYGLWPHSWSLYNVGAQTLTTGVSVFNYQITDIGSTLEIGTFCHENGHMLCDYPDLYDYEYDSRGGAGVFCLMGGGGHGTNPSQICAYLKRASGWATTIELTNASSLMATLGAPQGPGFNTFYRFAKPGTATEYYLLENRQNTGYDANLPASGVAIWHVDELGDRDNQSLAYNTSHANYELTLVQADNLWHFQGNSNGGDAYDLYHGGNTAAAYVNLFSDATTPAARWWDGTASGINFGPFSARGCTMTFNVQPPGLSILTSSPLPSGTVGLPYGLALAAFGGTEPYAWSITSGTLPAGLNLAGNVVTGTPTTVGTSVFQVRTTDAALATADKTFNLTVNPARTVPFSETFESAGALPAGWSQAHVAGATDWIFQSGGYGGHPGGAHGGSYNAFLYYGDWTSKVTWLVSPPLDFGKATENARLTFWHCMQEWEGDQDELRVYAKSGVAGDWQLLSTYTANVSSWTQRTLALPEPGPTYFIAFEGTTSYGYGVCVDDVTVTADLTPYGSWQTNHFSAAEVAAGLITGDTDDPDGDGIPNLLEYAFFLSPRAANTGGIPTGGLQGQYLTYQYRQNKQATDLAYAVEACTSLVHVGWSTNGVSEAERGDSNLWWQVTVRHDVPVTDAPARFLRLKVDPR